MLRFPQPNCVEKSDDRLESKSECDFFGSAGAERSTGRQKEQTKKTKNRQKGKCFFYDVGVTCWKEVRQIRSVLASHPMPLAKSRTWRGLTISAGNIEFVFGNVDTNKL